MAFQGNAFQAGAFQAGGILAPVQVITITVRPPTVRVKTSVQPQTLFLNISLMRPYISAFKAAEVLRDMPRLNPIYLIEVTLKNNGPTLYFSDRGIEIGSRIYEDYLKDLSGIGEELKRVSSVGLNADIQLDFKNDKWQAYNYLIEAGDTYPFEGAECLIKEIYLDGNDFSEPVTLFKGVLDSPDDIDLMGFKCKVSSMPYAKDRGWKQAMIDTLVYPNAYEDVGKVEPMVYGGSLLMPALRTDWGARTTLKAEITAAETSLELSDAVRFPASGSVWLDNEKIGYASKTGNTLASLTRGQSGAATAHRAGAEVWEHKSVYESVLSGHELYSVGDIYAEIAGKLLRVDSGVSAVYENGKHKIKATAQIKVEAVKETITVTNPTHIHDTENTSVINQIIEGLPMGGTTQSSGGDLIFETTFPAFSGQRNAVQYKVSVQLANCQASGSPYFQISVGGYTKYLKLPSDLSFDYYGSFTATFTVISGEYGLSSNALSVKFHTGTGGGGLIVQAVDRTISTKTASESTAPNVQRTGDVVSTHTVDRFHAVVSGYKDMDGNYGGLGNLIERPDYVIKHFLIQKLGFSLSDIDTTSFNAAGALYASAISGGYKFAFETDGKIKPSEFINQLAFECRSTLKYEKGIWYLDYIPDTAPAAVKTISKEELAGQFAKFTFSKTPTYDVFNDLTASFKKNYSRQGSESEWDGTSKAEDAASIAKYGTYPKDMEFGFIRLQAMADSVLGHILKQRKTPLLTVRFTVFWEHFDLNAGDTIEIENTLYDGRKFHIEGVRRLDKWKAEVKAVEWW
ncbi:MAG: phage tail protein [Thermodesulfovibrionales bacterium]|nr:phage tail protein [Thermodesulfovibrionales bacterium]